MPTSHVRVNKEKRQNTLEVAPYAYRIIQAPTFTERISFDLL